MALTTADYNAVTDKLNEAFIESATSAIEDWKGKQLFDVVDTDWRVYDYAGFYGLPGPSRVAEGQEYPTVTSAQGDTASFTQKIYGEKVSITKAMRKFDRIDLMQDLVRSVVDATFHLIDQSFADHLTNGFSGSTYTDVWGDTVSNLATDGVVLFSASHTNNVNSTTFRNLIRNAAGTANPALDRASMVKARSDAMTYKDPNGLNRPTNLDTLIVSAANDDLANRLIFSTGIATTPNVDINPLRGQVKNVISWSKLDTRTGGTDTSAYWFMADSRKVKNSLKGIFAQKPMLGAAENVTETQNWLYPLDLYYTVATGYPAFIFGSTGVN